jgi:hypothetical protein
VAGGSGADRIDLDSESFISGDKTRTGTAQIYLGGLAADVVNAPSVFISDTDVDVVKLSLKSTGFLAPTIWDFHTGSGGDQMDLVSVNAHLVALGMTKGADPFAAGYLRLLASGSDTVLEVDSNGATLGAKFQTLALIKGVESSSFTAANFVQGYTPRVTSNQAPVAQADKTLLLQEDSMLNALGLIAPTDPDGGTPIITVTELPTYGQIRLASNVAVTRDQILTGAQLEGLTYTPGFNQNDQNNVPRRFIYTVLDDEGSQINRTVTLEVQPANDPPTSSHTRQTTNLSSVPPPGSACQCPPRMPRNGLSTPGS